MEGYVYILLSLKDRKTYTGSTDSLARRVEEHQRGLVKSTRNRLPVELIYYERYDTLTTAREKEQYYKNCSGRKKLKVLLRDKIK